MVFSSILFLFVFLPLTLAAYHLSPARARNTVLLLASLLFYAWGAPRFVFVLIASVWVDWVAGLRIAALREGRSRQWWLAAGIVLNLGLLAYFKYANFAVSEWNRLAAVVGFDGVEWGVIALPIGISFFTFQKVSYLMDVHRNATPPARTYGQCLLYIILFPQLIAGPIVRYHDVAAQILRRQRSRGQFLSGVQRFAVGLGKKVLIANVLAATADAVFGLENGRLGLLHAWLGVIAYAFQIYFDFSGYSDMAIGLGRMFGFEFLENFNRPYRSRTVTEFWQRWHISLSNFMREYLYIPLGGNRVSPLRRYANLWIVFLLSGLWHGATWNFIAWGAYQGLFLTVDRLFWAQRAARLPALLARAIAFVVVLFGWVLFRASDLTAAGHFISRMVGITRLQHGAGFVLWSDLINVRGLFTLVAAALIVFRPERVAADGASSPNRMALPAALALLVLSACSLANSTYNPFIYFRF